MTLSNALTVIRIFLSFLFLWFLFREGLFSRLAALVFFLVASLTDFYDGQLARLKQQVSSFGALLDPIADKILVLSALIGFVQMGLIPAWMVVLVLTRELVMTGVRLLALTQGKLLPAASIGKHKTATQMGGILWVLSILVLRELPKEWIPQAWAPAAVLLKGSVYWVMFGVVWVTVSSGLLYLWRNRFLLRK